LNESFKLQDSTQYLPVSVIVPVYNAGKFIEQCIDSINTISNSAYRIPAEIILIDDHSTDNSIDVIANLTKKHSNLKLLQTERNSGAAAARKKGIFAAEYNFIALVDADDLIEEGAIEDAYNRFTEGIDLVIWELWKLEIDGSTRRTQANPTSFPLRGEEALLRSLGGWNAHPLGIARKQNYVRAYDDFSIESYNADELITRLLFKGCRSIAGSSKKYFYRTNPNSTTQTISDKHLTVLRSHIWLIELCLKTNNAPTASVALGAIYTAYTFFKQRNLYNKRKLNTELFKFILSAASIPFVWKAMLVKPKYLGVFALLSLYSAQQKLNFSTKNFSMKMNAK
jgi:glycosyltransferase involved in cell wall biosynthesis